MALASGGLCIAAEALLQLQLGGVHGLLFPQVGLDAPLMPLAHAPVADQDIKYHHQHLQGWQVWTENCALVKHCGAWALRGGVGAGAGGLPEHATAQHSTGQQIIEDKSVATRLWGCLACQYDAWC